MDSQYNIMDNQKYIWTKDLAVKVFKLKFENDSLFRNTKQPWGEFYKILLETGFPKEITAKQVMRKWTTTYNKYLAVRKKKHTSWIYYDLFDKVYGTSSTFDKYESWSYDWRIKLINSISKAKELDLDFERMWKTVEKSMRKLRLPSDCYIQDLKGLWAHLKGTFSRKHKLKLKKGITDWPYYEAMYDYYERFDPDYLVKMETDCDLTQGETSLNQSKSKYRKEIGDEEFEWTQDKTEIFIQLRLQNDLLFREKKCNWNDLLAVMIQEYKFPGTLTARDLFRKWASIYYEHQKAKAMNDKTWIYYNLFEHYLGESNFNPLVDWQEEWVFNLISARTDLQPVFKSCNDEIQGWREVEKKLRNIGIPLDHSLLDIPEIWTHLWRSFKLKQKLANKGQLNGHWPYYDAMNYYYILENASEIKVEHQFESDDYENDVRHKHKKPNNGRNDLNICRSCYNNDGSLDIFEQKDAKGINLAYKLKVVGGVKVERTDSLPSLICVNCAEELENAYKFRAKCQVADRRLRKNLASDGIKVTATGDENDTTANEECEEIYADDTTDMYLEYQASDVPVKKEKTILKPKRKYVYRKICEKCGKCVRNMYAHKDVHTTGKTYACDICDKKFKFRSGMMLHRDVHNPRPRKTCEVCGKVFYTLLNFRNHRIHHENQRKYKCETCGKRFNTSTILKMHMSSHSDERPFGCHECGKAFKWVQNLRKHLRTMHKSKEKYEE